MLEESFSNIYVYLRYEATLTQIIIYQNNNDGT